MDALPCAIFAQSAQQSAPRIWEIFRCREGFSLTSFKHVWYYLHHTHGNNIASTKSLYQVAVCMLMTKIRRKISATFQSVPLNLNLLMNLLPTTLGLPSLMHPQVSVECFVCNNSWCCWRNMHDYFYVGVLRPMTALTDAFLVQTRFKLHT